MTYEVGDDEGGEFLRQELGRASLKKLLCWRVLIDAEVRARGHVRTASSLAGELMERVVANAYGGELVAPGAKSVDVRLPDGRGLQVKARSLPRGDLRHWAFHDFNFDVAVVIALDRENVEILWARELTPATVAALARPHAKDGWRLRMAAVHGAGEDVTERLCAAYDAL